MLFVLDFDGTYDNEYDEGYGVEPLVYLIPLDKQIEVERIADAARFMVNIQLLLWIRKNMRKIIVGFQIHQMY